MPDSSRTPMSRPAVVAALRADLGANRGYPKSVLVLALLRAAQYARSGRGTGARAAYVVAATAYKVVAEWVLGVELPPSTSVGGGLRLRHGVGLVVNPFAVIGENVLLRHGVTIGNRLDDFDCPVIGRDVEIGAGATIIGRVTIGDGARIGAGALVIGDVPAGGVAVAPPAHIRPPRTA